MVLQGTESCMLQYSCQGQVHEIQMDKIYNYLFQAHRCPAIPKQVSLCIEWWPLGHGNRKFSPQIWQQRFDAWTPRLCPKPVNIVFSTASCESDRCWVRRAAYSEPLLSGSWNAISRSSKHRVKHFCTTTNKGTGHDSRCQAKSSTKCLY